MSDRHVCRLGLDGSVVLPPSLIARLGLRAADVVMLLDDGACLQVLVPGAAPPEAAPPGSEPGRPDRLLRRARPITEPELQRLERELPRRSHVPVGPVRGLLALYHHTAAQLRAFRAQQDAAASGGAAPPAKGQQP